MQVHNDDILVFRTSDPPQEYRVSNIDNQVVKLLGMDGQYRQMPYRNILELINKGYIIVKSIS